mgnify:CR=1 FL=1
MARSIPNSVRLALLVCAAPLAVNGQETQEDDGLLDEIVVSAQKREESLRDVPLSVEALSGNILADMGVQRMDDLKSYVPNLQMTETGIANNFYVRGIGSGLNQGFEQSVSIYQDGIYRGRGHQSRLPFMDEQRVEVLRGPQPVLFSKNAVAGAVNLVANRPTREFEGSASGSYDFENEDTIASLVLSGPLNESLAGRVAVHHRNSDGYVDNKTLGRNEPLRDELGARVTLDLDISDRTDASWRTEFGSYNVRGRQVEIFGETPIATGAFAGLTYSRIVSGTPPLPQGQHPTAADNQLNYERSSNGDSSKLSNFETAMTVNFRHASGVTLTSITGISNYTLDEKCDCDFVGAWVFDAGITEDYTQFSQELRFTSPADARLAWIGGLFFQRYALDETDYLHVPDNSLVVPVLSAAFAANPALGGTPQSRAALANFFREAVNPRQFRQTSELWSAFLQGSWDFNDQWKLTAGGRLNYEEKFGSRATQLTRGFDGPAMPAPVLPLFNQVLGIVPHSVADTRYETNFSPLVNLQYRLAPESMVYLSWSQGSKSGGFDARSNRPPPPASTGSFEYPAEKATTYELGMKTAVGARAEINADVFFTDYKDLQTSAFDGAIGFNVGNGSAEVKGIELEGRWRATRDFTISGSVAWLDFEWTDYAGQCYFGRPPDAGTNCNYDGFSNQLAPEFTGVLSGDYRWLMGDSLKVNARLDVVYSSEFLQSLTLDPATTQESFTKLNARVSLGGIDDRWQVAVVGRNLTDKQTVSYAGDTPLASRLFSARSYYGFVDMPRSIAVELSLAF